jgi:short-subunit dehydrogenase
MNVNDDATPHARYGGWAVVAGASAGLGAAFAREAARCGFDVALVARRAEVLEETAAALRDEFGCATRCIVADLADDDAAARIVAATDDHDVGVLVYNAAAELYGRFLDQPDDEFRVNAAVNVVTPTILTREFGRRMAARGRGAIALVSSMAALQGAKWLAIYAASKAYELILAEALWEELRPEQVDVMGYVVGATASSSWHGAGADAAYATGGDDISDLQARILAPALPADVAARCLARLHLGPRQFSHDTDEAAAHAAAIRPRDEVVRAMGAVTTGLARFQYLRDAGYR